MANTGVLVALSVVLLFSALPQVSPPQNTDRVAVHENTAERILHTYDSIGGYFIENRGQVAGEIRYYSRGNPSVAFRDDGVMFVTTEEQKDGVTPDRRPFDQISHFSGSAGIGRTAKSLAYIVRFEGARTVKPIGIESLPFSSNFFIGNNPAGWRTHVANYREIVYQGIYEGVDLVYHLSEKGIKYDLILSPGADLSVVTISYEGIERIELDRADNMLVHTAIGDFGDSAPIAFQGGDSVSCSFNLRTPRSYGFDCQSVDRSRPLVIDPLFYSTFLGGGWGDSGNAVATDPSGNAYVTGITASTDFPTTFGAFDKTLNGPPGGYNDIFVAKLDSSGSWLMYSTYLGGSDWEIVRSIATDSSGNAYVTGATASMDFPVTAGAFNTTPNAGHNAFVAKLDVTGSSLVYSTYLCGGVVNGGNSIAVDSAGNAYVAGETDGTDFPVSPFGFDTTYNGGTHDGFVMKLNSTGGSLLYSTFIGGGDWESVLGISADSAGNVYMVGNTKSADFPVTLGAFDTIYNGLSDAFVAKLNPIGTMLVYSSFLGGSGGDGELSISTDSAGNAYVAGETESADFPTTIGAFDRTLNGIFDDFVTKVNPTGNSLVYSTYLGGSDADHAASIAVDSFGNAYVAGHTLSTDFPVTLDAFDTTFNGLVDMFITELDPTGSSLLYSTYLGGGSRDFYGSAAVDSANNAYVTGETWSTDFPVTPGVFDTTFNGGTDAFVVKLKIAANNSPPYVSGLGVQGFVAAPKITHITDFTPDLNWTYIDPDGDPQAWYDLRIGGAPGTADIWDPSAAPGSAAVETYGGTSLLRGVDYYFGIKVSDGLEWGPEAEVKFHVNSIPNPPTPPISPEQSPPIPAGLSQTTSWTSGGDAEGDAITYEWEVATDPSFGTAIAFGTTSATTSALFVTNPSTTYYWRAWARDDYEPTTWSAYGNSPPGYWTFSTLPPPNTPPTIAIISPVGGEVWQQHESRTVTWTASDREDPPSSLVVFINYTSSAGGGLICGPVAGDVGSCVWILPAIDSADVVVNATVIDTGGLKGYDDSGPFAIQPEVNTPPTVLLTSPEGGEVWDKGSSHNITWSMQDAQDPDSNLTIYLNYTTGGTTTTIVAAQKGTERFLWTLPNTEATDVVVNVTVIDTGGLKGWDQSGPFAITGPPPPPPENRVEFNYKPIVAVIFAVILLVTGLWSSKRRPWKGGNGRMAVTKAFAITSLPFVILEAATGIVSFLTGLLSIPPFIGVGTAVDLGILLAGVATLVSRGMKSGTPETE